MTRAPVTACLDARWATALVMLLSGVGIAACDGDPLADGLPTEIDCVSCHGDEDSFAPPMSIAGETATTAIGVGAHRTHLETGSMALGLDCDACHVNPTTIGQEGHIDPLPAEVVFGSVGSADEAATRWNRSEASCVTYCHGATLGGGSHTTPIWTQVDETQATCGSCHGLPPPAPHPGLSNCVRCHPQTVTADSEIRVINGKHINGVVDVVDLECNRCHGDDESDAPPLDASGNSDPGLRSVGAHREHLASAGWHATIACDTCHRVPATIDAPGHNDSPLPAELTWGGTATAAGASPSFDGSTCANVYCHGATLTDAGGTNTQPVWTTVDGTQDGCGTCHANPPTSNHHPRGDDCARCHGMVINPDRSFNDPQRHIDGIVDVDPLACDSCHGSGGNGAPPFDLAGNSDPSFRGVGAHREHLAAADWHAAIACDSCHLVPASAEAVGHTDSALPAELSWSNTATAAGAAPSFNGSSCSDVYCHGATLGDAGGSNTQPEWTTVDGSQDACGTCHANPPISDRHPQDEDCARCHGMVINSDRSFNSPERHIDGIVDVDPVDCDSCHGSNGSGAPPFDLSGNSDPSLRGVGAHREHLASADWRASMGCEACHLLPQSLEDPGHVDSGRPAELTWGSTATAGGAAPSFDGSTCSDVYCHGTTLTAAGGSHTRPVWTTVDGTQDACGTCHANPPTSNRHPRDADCARCHGMVINPDGSFNSPQRHIDGIVDVDPVGCDTCHGGGGNAAPPFDLSGNSDPSFRGVGAHREHLAAADWRAPMTCEACHLVPQNLEDPDHVDSAGPAELVFGSLATTGPASPSFDGTACSDVYCHGATLAGTGGTNTQPAWTTVDGTQAACGACHAMPPTGGQHPANADCGQCHDPVYSGSGFVAPELHINGTVEIGAMTCTSCHSIPGSPINPEETNGELAAGKHLAHATIDCAVCHLDYDQVGAHRDGQYGVGVVPATRLVYFDPGSAAGAAASFTDLTDSSGELLCSMACHGPASEADWYRVASLDYTCADCHRTAIGSRRQVFDSNGDGTGVGGDFNRTSHHVIDYVDPGATIVTEADCLVCHDLARHAGGAVDLVDQDAATSILYDPADATSLEPFCLGCHDQDGAMAQSTPFTPFSGPNTLGVVPNEAGVWIGDAWAKTDGHGKRGLTCVGDGTPGTGCHGSYDTTSQVGSINAHGSDNAGLLANAMVLPIPNSTFDERRFALCFDCHDNYPSLYDATALLGVAPGGNYAQQSPQLPQYSVDFMESQFHDYLSYGYDRQWNLHTYHVAGGVAWAYRGVTPQPTSIGSCPMCHDVHGSNSLFFLWDQWGFELQVDNGTEYGQLTGAAPAFNGPLRYPEYCSNACHWDTQFRYPRTYFNEVRALAEDTSGMGPGLQSGDTITLHFSSSTNAPTIDESNIDELLPTCQSAASNHYCTSPEHSWVDSDKGAEVGEVTAVWSSSNIDGRADDILTITLFVSSEGLGDPTVLDTDKIIINEPTANGPGSGITDLNGTEFRGHVQPVGGF